MNNNIENVESDFSKHLFSRLNINSLMIIICDEKFSIKEITPEAKRVFEAEIGEYVADFIDINICKKGLISIKTKECFVVYDTIDDFYYEIDVSAYSNDMVLIFNKKTVSNDAEMSDLAMEASQHIKNYLNKRTPIMDIVHENVSYFKNIDKFEEKLNEEKENMIKLYEFNAKLASFFDYGSKNILHFKTQSLTEFMQALFVDIKKIISDCDINLNMDQEIILHFNQERMTLLFVQIFTNIFRISGKKTKLLVDIDEKDQKVHIKIYDFENCFRKALLDDDDYARLAYISVKKITNAHDGQFFYQESEEGSFFYMILPAVACIEKKSDDFLNNAIEYFEKSIEIQNCIKILGIYD